jgi:hypothetical protein
MSEKKPLPACGQCGKPSVVEAGGQGLCVDCWHKFDVARTMAFRLSAIGANFALDQMDDISGLPRTGARMQVPPIPQGPPILNNIKVDNSVVGSINTGNVRTIDVSLTYLHSAGNDRTKDALKALTEAILSDTSIGDTHKNELVEQVAFLSEQAIAGARDRKPGLIKATFGALTQAAGTVSAMAGAWQAAEPILRSVFGL